jgi:peptidoglycan/xylan/chitin deacetylase (PgdA/CDA1 family)
MLSFDDGSGSQAQEGLVQLAKRGMTGTFFVMTVVLGKRPHSS